MEVCIVVLDHSDYTRLPTSRYLENPHDSGDIDNPASDLVRYTVFASITVQVDLVYMSHSWFTRFTTRVSATVQSSYHQVSGRSRRRMVTSCSVQYTPMIVYTSADKQGRQVRDPEQYLCFSSRLSRTPYPDKPNETKWWDW